METVRKLFFTNLFQKTYLSFIENRNQQKQNQGSKVNDLRHSRQAEPKIDVYGQNEMVHYKKG